MSVQYYELYRNSSLGASLTDALDELIGQQLIPPQLALKILTHFDKATTEELAKVKDKISFKGSLDTYRFCDEVWTFLLRDVSIKPDVGEPLTTDRVKIVSCNSKKPGET